MTWIPVSERLPETSKPVFVTVVLLSDFDKTREVDRRVSHMGYSCVWNTNTGEREWRQKRCRFWQAGWKVED